MVFEFFLGGYFHDHSYRVLLDGDRLRISDFIGIPIPENDKLVSVENNQQWNLLISYLTRSKWKKRYDSETLDGTQWELKAVGEGFKVNSYGSNAYPEDFDQFLMLLNDVLSYTGINIQK